MENDYECFLGIFPPRESPRLSLIMSNLDLVHNILQHQFDKRIIKICTQNECYIRHAISRQMNELFYEIERLGGACLSVCISLLGPVKKYRNSGKTLGNFCQFGG